MNSNYLIIHIFTSSKILALISFIFRLRWKKFFKSYSTYETAERKHYNNMDTIWNKYEIHKTSSKNMSVPVNG